MVRLTPEEKDALGAPLPQSRPRAPDLWDLDDPAGELRGAGVVIAVCLFGLVFGLALPFFLWLYLR